MKLPKSLIMAGCALAVCFGVWVWPGAWTYDRIDGRTVRTNRFTGRVQRLTLDGWIGTNRGQQKDIGLPNSIAVEPTSEQLGAVEGNLGFKGLTNSEFGGELYNGSSKAITGTVVFHVIVKSKSDASIPPPPKGFVLLPLADRRIRELVNWPPQHAAYVSINPAWQFDSERETFEWHIEPVNGSTVYKAGSVEIFYLWGNKEYRVVMDGQDFTMNIDPSKRPNWGSQKGFEKLVSELREWDRFRLHPVAR